MPSKKLTGKSPESSVQSIEIDKIRMDGGTQPRAQLFKEVVEDYAEDMRQGATFPPVTIYFDGEEYWLADGFHRVRAKEAIGIREVTAEVHVGTQREAVLYAVGANAVHGLRRTNADKRRAVVRLLRDYEWRKWSDREIARRCGVSASFVGDVRKDLSVVELQTDSTENEFDIDPTKRRVMRGGTAFEMDTTNIRNRPKSDEERTFKRKRSKKQPHDPKSLETRSKEVNEGDIWKLGKSHYLFCGDLDSRNFQELLPSEIDLLLFFPRETEPWLQKKPANVMNTLSFYTSFGDDIDLKNFRLMLENCLFTTTEADDSIVVFNLPDPLLFILVESVYCCCYCAESDPERCTEALNAWMAINQPVRKLST